MSRESRARLWRVGLMTTIAVSVVLLILTHQENLNDYLRISAWTQGIYIIFICVRVAEVNYRLRRDLDRRGDSQTIATAKLLPTHIVMLALGTIGSVVLLSSVMLTRFGDSPLYDGLPWLINVVFLVKALGLNMVWAFIEQRRKESE